MQRQIYLRFRSEKVVKLSYDAENVLFESSICLFSRYSTFFLERFPVFYEVTDIVIVDESVRNENDQTDK